MRISRILSFICIPAVRDTAAYGKPSLPHVARPPHRGTRAVAWVKWATDPAVRRPREKLNLPRAPALPGQWLSPLNL